MNMKRAAFAVTAAAAAAAGVDGAGAGPCLPAVGSSRCPADEPGFVFAGNQLVCNCEKGSFSSGLVKCADGHADPVTLPYCDAPKVPQVAMPCASDRQRCPAGSAWFQSNRVNVCFCEKGYEDYNNNLHCNQNNVRYAANVKTLPKCSAEPAFVNDFPCRAAGRLCASGWIQSGNEVVCNCINGTIDYRGVLMCSGQTVPVNRLGLCSEGESTAPPAPTTAPTKRTLPPVAQVACTVPPSPGIPPVNTTGLCFLPSEEYCCYVAGKRTCITQDLATCGDCACADPDTSAAARPASGAAALLAALLMLAASL